MAPKNTNKSTNFSSCGHRQKKKISFTNQCVLQACMTKGSKSLKVVQKPTKSPTCDEIKVFKAETIYYFD